MTLGERLALLRTLTDPKVFGPLVGGPTFRVLRVCIAAILGVVPDSDEDRATILKHTGRSRCPTAPALSAFIIAGRRAGKSLLASLLGILFGAFHKWQLSPGEVGVVAILAADRRQGQVIKGYISATLRMIPMLTRMVAEETKDTITLTNGIVIEISTANFRTIRGRTVVCAICDELAFWRTESSANPDSEILTALKPSMATVPGSMLICLSSPYSRRGELWRAYEGHFAANDDPILVWQSGSRAMNPTVPAETVKRAYEEDPAAAAAEWGGHFREDLEHVFALPMMKAVTIPGRKTLSPVPGCSYKFFTDPASGSPGGDDWPIVGCHVSGGGIVVIDIIAVRRPPFSPLAVAEEYAAICARYGVTEITGDRYAPGWVADAFAKHDITYGISEKVKSDLYREALGIISAGRVELPDDDRMIAQFCALERRTTRGTGKDVIDHAPVASAHDDISNCVAGAMVIAGGGFGKPQLPEFTRCLRAENVKSFDRAACFLWGGMTVPLGDPSCLHHCVGWLSVKEAREQYAAETGERPDYRSFYRNHMIPSRVVWLEDMRRQLRNVWNGLPG